MGRSLLIILSFLSGQTWGQNLFSVIEDPLRDYTITSQDSIVDHFGKMLTITADLSVVNWGEDTYKMHAIRFAHARQKGDTIYIKIHETNTVFDYEYDLQIVKDKFTANFWFQTTIDSAVRRIETVDSKLIIKNKDFRKGAFLIGYTDYKGRCVSYFDKNEIYIVKGTFKVQLE